MLLSALCRVRRRLYRSRADALATPKNDVRLVSRVHLGDAARADGRRVDVEHVAPVGPEVGDHAQRRRGSCKWAKRSQNARGKTVRRATRPTARA